MNLGLGLVDRGRKPADLKTYFQKYHEAPMLGYKKFRGEKDGEWISLTETQGSSISELQGLLRELGFYPQGEVDGFVGYRTLSAVRLFQEYVRTVESISDIGTPDGIVGPKTSAHLRRWKSDRLKSEWSRFSPQSPGPAYRYWMEVLKNFRQFYSTPPFSQIIQLTESFRSTTDTMKVGNWKYDPQDLHLIGIRRQEWRSTQNRANDDLFILLINGLAFVFFGSTDPNPSLAGRPDEAYIVRGQHRYRFGWHKLSNLPRSYRAFRPASQGVLICRDSTRDDAFTDEDLAAGLSRNATINLHWSGLGISNWSAGCQVISGARYLNHLNQKIDCTPFAARTYTDLPRKTRAAYNVLLDLLTVFAPDISVEGGSTLYYTLLYERDLDVRLSANRTLSATALDAAGQSPGGDARVLSENVHVDTLVNRLVRND